MSDFDVGSLLRAVAPDRLPEALRAHLQRELGTGHVEVLLPDYNQSNLWPVLGGDAGDITLAARCYSSQQSVTGRGPRGITAVHLPLSTWGERLGVLIVEPGPDAAESLQCVADQFALALRAADGDTDRYRRVNDTGPPPEGTVEAWAAEACSTVECGPVIDQQLVVGECDSDHR